MLERAPRPQPAADARIGRLLAALEGIILGKRAQLELALACLLARGHLLIEDLPGVGKTTLAHALARALGLQFVRIQFTSDLLPADILGVSVFDRSGSRFEFHPGPLFAQLILADEVNRATPKTQSALLEAMEEHQVTVDGVTRRLPEPFFVVATQNPRHQVGTFALPESQLDRFTMRIDLGYPAHEAERALLRGEDRRTLIDGLAPCVSAADLAELQRAAHQVHTADPIVAYVQALLAASRAPGRYRAGLSPRAGLALVRAAQAWALLRGRDFVVPEDVQAVLPAVAGHRLQTLDERASAPAAELLHSVAIP